MCACVLVCVRTSIFNKSELSQSLPQPAGTSHLSTRVALTQMYLVFPSFGAESRKYALASVSWTQAYIHAVDAK